MRNTQDSSQIETQDLEITRISYRSTHQRLNSTQNTPGMEVCDCLKLPSDCCSLRATTCSMQQVGSKLVLATINYMLTPGVEAAEPFPAFQEFVFKERRPQGRRECVHHCCCM